METSYKDDLKDLIAKSNLNNNQKLLWELFLIMSDEDENEAVLEAAKESEENLTLLTKHLRDKIWDMKQNDNDVWRNLTKEEEKYAGIL